MGASLSTNNETIMSRKESLLEGRLEARNGRYIVQRSTNITSIIRNFVRETVEKNLLKKKLKSNSLYNHHDKASSVYNFNSKNKDYLVKLDVSLYEDYLDNGLEITRHVNKDAKDISPKIQEKLSDVLEIIIDEKTSESIKRQIKLVEKNKNINLSHLYNVFKPNDSIFCLVLVMEKLDMSLEEYIQQNKRSNKDLDVLKGKLEVLLNKLHNLNICHNDIHDGNFMIKNDKWYIIDFGESRYTTGSNKKCFDHRLLDHLFDIYKRNNSKRKTSKK